MCMKGTQIQHGAGKRNHREFHSMRFPVVRFEVLIFRFFLNPDILDLGTFDKFKHPFWVKVNFTIMNVLIVCWNIPFHFLDKVMEAEIRASFNCDPRVFIQKSERTGIWQVYGSFYSWKIVDRWAFGSHQLPENWLIRVRMHSFNTG